MESQGAQTAKTVLEKEKEAKGLTLPDFNLIIKLQSSKRCVLAQRDTEGTEPRNNLPHIRSNDIPTQKNNSKCFKGLNVRLKTITLLEENKGQKFHDTGFGSEFLDMA